MLICALGLNVEFYKQNTKFHLELEFVLSVTTFQHAICIFIYEIIANIRFNTVRFVKFTSLKKKFYLGIE